LKLNKLRELITAEISRRESGIDMQPAFCFVVHDRPGAMTDTATAVASIIEQTEGDGSTPPVCVTRSIGAQVADALQAKFPKRLIISSPIVGPSDSMRERGRLVNEPQVEPGRDHDAVRRRHHSTWCSCALLRPNARHSAGDL
jgi:hypothetical protein